MAGEIRQLLHVNLIAANSVLSLEISPNFTNNMRNIQTEHEPWIRKLLFMKNKREARNLSISAVIEDQAHTFLRQQSGTWCKMPDLLTTCTFEA